MSKIPGNDPHLVRDPLTGLVHQAQFYEDVNGRYSPITVHGTWCDIEVGLGWVILKGDEHITCLSCIGS
jgi:hypothetical protein